MRLDVLKEIERLKLMDIKINFAELGRRMNCDPRTAKKYYLGETKMERKKVVKESILKEFIPIIEDKVDNCSATATSIFKFIEKKGYKGKYGLVKNYVRDYKNKQIKKATMRFETIPGAQAQVDWKEKKKLVSKNGEIFEVNIFLYVLGYSRFKYLEVTLDKKQDTLFKCINNAFHYSNGIPKEILFDNMSTVVDKNDTNLKHVKFNKKFEQFSKDYGFVPIACRPYRPQTKGKVEALAKLTNRLDVYNYEFETFEDLIEIVKEVNLDLNNEISQSINDKPINRLENEKEHLNPLPSNQIVDSYTTLPKMYSVSKESMITYKGNKYSVPTYYIGKLVEVKESTNEIQVYYNTNLIVTHSISESFLNYKKDHIIEILKSDAFKFKELDEIESFVEKNLIAMDMIIK